MDGYEINAAGIDFHFIVDGKLPLIKIVSDP
jgi:hypothetical protein